MCTVYFVDGKPLECPNVTIEDLYVLFRVSKVASSRIQCRFAHGRSTILLDIYSLDPEKTFGKLYKPEDFQRKAA